MCRVEAASQAVVNLTERIGFLILCLCACATALRAQTWTPLGPPGGDVRVLAADPSRLGRVFLGTADGHIFGSEDSGGHWTLLGRASSRLDAVITAIVADPRDASVLFASSWDRDSAARGGIFRSADGGRTWREAGLAGQAVRALVTEYSRPDILVAGTLDGIYRSLDAARSWERISPENHQELRNFDSLAIDPRDPETIYAGTYHLPWKTTDGGRTWSPAHEGMIDDSDVMSLLIDGSDNHLVYASACSGIYRSNDAGGVWSKIQGIPYAARRTYAIAQDPKHPAGVFAATSEGLWKTDDGGTSWRRTTPESWAINSVVVLGGEPERVLIGTEQFGVLASDDLGEHFQDANTGFRHREILALGLDPKRPSRMLAFLGNGPQQAMATEDQGKTWVPLDAGLPWQQVLRAYAAPNGDWWVSLARGGLMRFDPWRNEWRDSAAFLNPESSQAHAVARSIRGVASTAKGKFTPLREVVSDLRFSSKRWFAATSAGLLVSEDQGATWARKAIGALDSLPVQSVDVSADGSRIRLVSLGGLIFSNDGGASWTWRHLPFNFGGALALKSDPDDESLWIVVARKGLYISRDDGHSWEAPGAGLPAIPALNFAAAGGMYVASMQVGGVYVSQDSGRTWSRVTGAPSDGLFAGIIPTVDPGLVFAISATEGLFAVDLNQPVAGNLRSMVWTPKQTSHKETSASN